jgi:hypothetical protein
MRAGADLEPRVRLRRRVGVGILELVPDEVEDRSVRTLRDNLANHVSALLVAIIVAAQVADVVTTFRALSGPSGYVESNPLLRVLMVRSPLAAYTVKMLLVTALVLVVLSRLRGRRAQAALAFAACLSLIAPLLNFLLLQHL